MPIVTVFSDSTEYCKIFTKNNCSKPVEKVVEFVNNTMNIGNTGMYYSL